MFGINSITMSNHIIFIAAEEVNVGLIYIDEDFFDVILLPKYYSQIFEVMKYYTTIALKKMDKVEFQGDSKDELVNSALVELGYTRKEEYRFNGFCDLNEMMDIKPLCKGYSFKVVEEADLEERIKIFGLATGGESTTVDYYKDMMKSSVYDDALDLVVVTDVGEIIAYCTFWYDKQSKIGVLEPLACKEEHRRKGIMKALLTYGLHYFKNAGGKYFYVGTSGSNIPSQTLYKSIGFADIRRNYTWTLDKNDKQEER